MKKKISFSKILAYAILFALAISCIAPITVLLSVSVSKISDIYENGYRFIPRTFSLDAYKYILSGSSQLLSAYWVTIKVVVIGTVAGLLIMSMMAYGLSRKDFKYRQYFAFFVFFTMLFQAGMVPRYILISNYLHMKNTLWVLIVPVLANAWHIMMLRTYFSSLPEEVMQAAKIDGCGELRAFFVIAIPMTKPALATVGLLTALHYWNDWWLALMYIEQDNLVPLNYLLYRTMSNLEELNRQAMEMGTAAELGDFPSESVRMAMAAAASIPMLLIFPFFQKYFSKGLTVGAVKG